MSTSLLGLRLRSLKYVLVFLTPAVVLMSLQSEGLWMWSAPVVLFGLIPLAEAFTRGSERNLSRMEEEVVRHDRTYDVFLYSLLPVQYVILYIFLERVSEPGILWYQRVSAVIAYGLAAGVLGINAAHELGHRPTRVERVMSRALLLTSLYMHFHIEHNRGHHARVATPDDPASARKGEHVYSFFIRSVRDGWRSAWDLESMRLRNHGHSFLSWRNEMLINHLIQVGLLAFIVLQYGAHTAACFLGGAIIGILLLEAVNYIEHYGLSRLRTDHGYERTTPMHSWNSNHPVGRLLLLELSRHSDHHYAASRKFQVLRHHQESPQMPTGYPGMILMALVPPVWFRIMDARLEIPHPALPAAAVLPSAPVR